MAAPTTQLIDFTLGFGETDRPWANWLRWVLESVGYTIAPTAEIRPRAPISASPGTHLIFIGSKQSVKSQATLVEQARTADRPIVTICVEDFPLPARLTHSRVVDWVGCDRATAQQTLLAAVRSLPLPFQPPPQRPFRLPQPPFPGHLSGQLIPTKRRGQIQGYVETLSDTVQLEMMQIPGGLFTMGAPESETGSQDRERPTHRVTVQPFWMGRYPVTQAQWRFVAELGRVDRELEPDPARFKGDSRPIERVSWLEAREFCARLSNHTGRVYRLPTEAEWEYACRGKTTTPFHFGETIRPDIANYNGNYTYGTGPTGEYRAETTPVGFFQVANAFGLYDLHGNVWEWCLDHWHENYHQEPSDESAWLNANASETALRVLRGGSWYYNPGDCRSAVRYWFNADNRYNSIGFRLVSPARILL